MIEHAVVSNHSARFDLPFLLVFSLLYKVMEKLNLKNSLIIIKHSFSVKFSLKIPTSYRKFLYVHFEPVHQELVIFGREGHDVIHEMGEYRECGLGCEHRTLN